MRKRTPVSVMKDSSAGFRSQVLEALHRVALPGGMVVVIASLCFAVVAHLAARADRDFLPKRFTNWSGVAQPVLIAYLIAAVILITLLVRRNRPVESSFLWSLAALVLAFRNGATGISA